MTYFPRTATFLILQVVALSSYASEPTPLELFDQRITPIFQSSDPSSCVQCHLASVDIKNYILPTAEATFVSMRDQGLIDLDAPGESKILNLIRMGDKDQDEQARLIHEQTRRAELEAFAAWIDACCQDERLRSLPASDELARPDVSDEVIRYARKSRVMDSFTRNVWSQRMRCFPCHTPHEIDPENPKHQAAIKTRKKFGEQFDEDVLQRLEIFKETPEATLSYLIEASRETPANRLPLLDLEDPTQSLVLLKPMAKLPKKREDGTFEAASYVLPISHMGGLKLHRDDQSYKSIVAWIRDYAHVVQGKYQSVDELPADNWHPTKLIVRVKAAPEPWNVGDTVQLFVHAWDTSKDDWAAEPLAFTQGTVTSRKIVNGALFKFGTGADEVNATLPKGRFLVKAYWDSEHKIANDPTAMLSKSDFVGQAEIPKARWREGFRFAEVISGEKLEKPAN